MAAAWEALARNKTTTAAAARLAITPIAAPPDDVPAGGCGVSEVCVACELHRWAGGRGAA